MKKSYINVDFSYNGNLGKLQQKTRDNLVFSDRLLQNNVISREDWDELRKAIIGYFSDEIKKAAENPLFFVDTLGE